MFASVSSVIRVNRQKRILSNGLRVPKKLTLFLYFTGGWGNTLNSAAICNSLLNSVAFKIPVFALFTSEIFWYRLMFGSVVSLIIGMYVF